MLPTRHCAAPPRAASLLHASCRPLLSLLPQREGDKLRGTKPVEAGIVKKLKEHLIKLLPTVYYLEQASYILLQATPTGCIDLNETPVGTDEWTLEFISRMRALEPATLRGLGTDYLFDRFSGKPMARANLISAEVTMLLLKQSVETFRLFSGEPSTCVEPAWLALLHFGKAPFCVARDVCRARLPMLADPARSQKPS